MEEPGMYKVTVECCCGCGVETAVPQVGALPLGWIGITWPERTVEVIQPGKPPIGPQPGSIKQRTLVFSSWRCANKHVKAMLQGQGDPDAH